jgi:hypothetical protein
MPTAPPDTPKSIDGLTLTRTATLGSWEAPEKPDGTWYRRWICNREDDQGIAAQVLQPLSEGSTSHYWRAAHPDAGLFDSDAVEQGRAARSKTDSLDAAKTAADAWLAALPGAVLPSEGATSERWNALALAEEHRAVVAERDAMLAAQRALHPPMPGRCPAVGCGALYLHSVEKDVWFCPHGHGTPIVKPAHVGEDPDWIARELHDAHELASAEQAKAIEGDSFVPVMWERESDFGRHAFRAVAARCKALWAAGTSPSIFDEVEAEIESVARLGGVPTFDGQARIAEDCVAEARESAGKHSVKDTRGLLVASAAHALLAVAAIDAQSKDKPAQGEGSGT